MTTRTAPSFFRYELLYILIGLTEAVWLTSFVILLLPGGRFLLNTASGGITLLAFTLLNITLPLILVRVVTANGGSEVVSGLLAVLGVGVSMVVTSRIIMPLEINYPTTPYVIHPLLITGAIITGLWYRGVSVATVTASVYRASFTLRLGIIGLVIAALIPDPALGRLLLIILPLFFFCGLVSTALARSASLRLNREGYRASFGVGWVGLTISISAVLTLTGYVLALGLSGVDFESVLGVFGQILLAVVTFFAYLMTPILNLFQDLAERLLIFIPLGNGSTPANPTLTTIQNNAAPTNPILTQLLSLLPMVCFSVALAGFLLVLVWRVRSRRFVKLRDDEERENLEGDGLLVGLQRAFTNGADQLGNALEDLASRLRPDDTALTIRRLYARMSLYARQNGAPRSPNQTPEEYAPLIAQSFPGYQQEITALTRAYVGVHYGELPDDPNELSQAKIAVEAMSKLVAKKPSALNN
jgi:hypothetical protein